MIKGSTIVRTSKPSRKEWKQSYSCFTEEDFLGKDVNVWGSMNREGIEGRSLDNKPPERRNSAPFTLTELIFQSSINPKK